MSQNTVTFAAGIARSIVTANPQLSLAEAHVAVDLVTQSLATLLQTDTTLVVPNLGTFIPYHGKPRKGRSPRNPSVEIVIPAKRRIKFKVNPELLNQ